MIVRLTQYTLVSFDPKIIGQPECGHNPYERKKEEPCSEIAQDEKLIL